MQRTALDQSDIEEFYTAVMSGDMSQLEAITGELPQLLDSTQTYLHKALVHAVSEGQEIMVAHLLKNGANANTLDEQKEPVIHIAARKGLLEILKLLSMNGGNFDTLTASTKRDILTTAVIYKQHSIANWLLESTNPNLNNQTNRGETALHIACRQGQQTLVIALINAGANPFLANSQGETPLAVCAPSIKAEIENIVQSVRAEKAVAECDIQTLQMILAEQNHILIYNAITTTDILRYIDTNNIEMLNIAAAACIELHEIRCTGNQSFLEYCLQQNKLPAFTFLLSLPGANCTTATQGGQSVLQQAFMAGALPFVDAMRQHQPINWVEQLSGLLSQISDHPERMAACAFMLDTLAIKDSRFFIDGLNGFTPRSVAFYDELMRLILPPRTKAVIEEKFFFTQLQTASRNHAAKDDLAKLFMNYYFNAPHEMTVFKNELALIVRRQHLFMNQDDLCYILLAMIKFSNSYPLYHYQPFIQALKAQIATLKRMEIPMMASVNTVLNILICKLANSGDEVMLMELYARLFQIVQLNNGIINQSNSPIDDKLSELIADHPILIQQLLEEWQQLYMELSQTTCKVFADDNPFRLLQVKLMQIELQQLRLAAITAERNQMEDARPVDIDLVNSDDAAEDADDNNEVEQQTTRKRGRRVQIDDQPAVNAGRSRRASTVALQRIRQMAESELADESPKQAVAAPKKSRSAELAAEAPSRFVLTFNDQSRVIPKSPSARVLPLNFFISNEPVKKADNKQPSPK